ncbi:MAG: UV DNA damage repair endonuclease UvsE [Promethearchaeota archaeon]|jgi:UV DNA damage endonuclease
MKIGYPCINLGLNCRSSKTFRLKNYSEQRLKETIKNNLNCLREILEFNAYNKLLFFRITSDLIPFASHPIMTFNWEDYFKSEFQKIGLYIKKHNMRITMHPGQYTVLNSKNEKVVVNSIEELRYHCKILELLGLDSTAKIVTHVGGVYGDKKSSIKRFIKRYSELDDIIKSYYVIENDDVSYNVTDTLTINNETEIPIILDSYHHYCNNLGESLEAAIEKVFKVWREKDGLPIIHYSSEHPTKGKCKHAEEIDIKHFMNFIKRTQNYNFDIVLEIKNKEQSALKALEIIMNDKRFNRNNI